jgi:hypothetical protein
LGAKKNQKIIAADRRLWKKKEKKTNKYKKMEISAI